MARHLYPSRRARQSTTPRYGSLARKPERAGGAVNPYYDSEVALQAVAAYFRWHKRVGTSSPEQPNGILTKTTLSDGRRVVKISNVHGRRLARYVERADGTLRRTSPMSPTALWAA